MSDLVWVLLAIILGFFVVSIAFGAFYFLRQTSKDAQERGAKEQAARAQRRRKKNPE